MNQTKTPLVRPIHGANQSKMNTLIERLEQSFYILCVLMYASLVFYMIFHIGDAFGAPKLPGSDESDKLEAAGTLLRIVDTALFSWISRILSALLLLSGGLALKDQRFGITALCVLGAILLATIPLWVRNIFDIGGGTIFSLLSPFGIHFYV